MEKATKPTKFSDRVSALRRRLGLNQQEMAEKLWISRSYLSEVENGLEPSRKVVDRVAMLENELDVGKPTVLHSQPLVSEEDAGYASEPRSILRRAREAKNWTPEELAKVSRVPAGFIRDVESGQ